MKLTLFALLLTAFLTAGCTCTKSRCRVATTAPATTVADAYTGHYEGTWQSAASGHHGKLKCDLSKISTGKYQANFKAYWSVLSGRYTVQLNARKVGRELRISGQEDLGALYGGVYHYQGSVTPQRLLAQYTAAKDYGTFDLRRFP